MSDEKPFDFVPKRHRVDGESPSSSGHVHNANCRHEQVISNGSADACATAQIMNALKYAAKRFPIRGNMTSALLQAKVIFCQSIVPSEIFSGAIFGLKAAFQRVLSVPESFIDFAVGKRGTYTNEDMNANLERGADTARRTRWDKYNRLIPYYFFHSIIWGEWPDASALVEPDKSQRRAWNGRVFYLGGKKMILKCQPHLRRGLISTLIQEYRRSETCRK